MTAPVLQIFTDEAGFYYGAILFVAAFNIVVDARASVSLSS